MKASKIGLTSLALMVGLLTLAAGPQEIEAVGSSPNPKVNRVLKDPRITEGSGLAHSTYKRSHLMVVNDSGGSREVFVVNGKGATVGTWALKGARNHDWEALAPGPHHNLWIGDVGDNGRKRKQVSVYRFREPKVLPKGRKVVKAVRFNFRYPDGRAHDAETLLVNPRNGRLHVVTKSKNGGGIYAAPRKLVTGRVMTLTRVGSAPALVTDGAWRPDGKALVLITYQKAYTYAWVGKGKPRVTPLPKRRQGESVTHTRDGKRLLLGSEGKRSPILSLWAPRPLMVSEPPVDEPEGSCQAPAYKAKGSTLFGVSLSAGDGSINEAAVKNDALFGPVPVVRQFDPGIPPEGAWSRRQELHHRTLVTSFKAPPTEVVSGKWDARLLSYFSQAPTGHPIFWSYYHEPESEIVDGDFTMGEYRAAWRHLVELVGSLCRPNLYPTLILTGWTADPASHRSWRDYYPGDDYISVVAWDPYNSANSQPKSYPEPAKLFAPVLKASQESGKPWAIAETGSARVAGDAGPGRAAWLAKVGAYFKGEGAAFVTYFQSTRDGMFKLDDEPSIAAWRKWVAGSGK